MKVNIFFVVLRKCFVFFNFWHSLWLCDVPFVKYKYQTVKCLCLNQWIACSNINCLQYWQWLWLGLYNIISALPDWAALNEFHVITGSVCKQPHVMVETTAWASISRSFFLFQSLPFIPSLAHLCGITRVDGGKEIHSHTYTQWETHSCTLSFPFLLSVFSSFVWSEPGVWCF